MRRTLLFATLVLTFFAVQSIANGSGPTLNREVAMALREARHADATANAALAASKRVPATIKGDVGATGSRGLDGQNGAPGLPGQNGATGAAGKDGHDGDRGPKGDQGPAGSGGVKAYGHITANGVGTTTQGTTVTHPGLGSYCMADQGFVSVVATPDSFNATVFELPPGSPVSSCPSNAWAILVNNNGGVDTGFYYVAN